MKVNQDVLNHQIFQMKSSEQESESTGNYKFVILKVNRIFRSEYEEKGPKFMI